MTEQSKLDQLKSLILRGHTHKPNTRCTAKQVDVVLPIGRPPGPGNPPVFCCLPAGHEGPHKCNHGGMSIPYVIRGEVEFRDPGSGSCVECRTGWPCATVKELEAILQEPVKDAT